MRTRLPATALLARRSVEIPCLIKGLDLPCWIPRSCMGRDHYTNIKVDGHSMGCHRAAYIELIGPIPAGLEIDHLCLVKACWNPWHLDVVTSSVNKIRCWATRVR